MLGSRAVRALLSGQGDKDFILLDDWLTRRGDDQLWATWISVAHLRSDIEQLSEVVRRTALLNHLGALSARFEGRLLEFDRNAALEWATIRLAAAGSNRMTTEDSMILATARSRGLAYVTDSHPVLSVVGAEFFDPWSDAS